MSSPATLKGRERKRQNERKNGVGGACGVLVGCEKIKNKKNAQEFHVLGRGIT